MLRRLAHPALLTVSLAACAGEEFTPAGGGASGGAASGGASSGGAAGSPSGGAAGSASAGSSAGSGGSSGAPAGGTGGVGGAPSGGGTGSGGKGGTGGGSGGSGGVASSCPAGGIQSFQDAFSTPLNSSAWSPYYLSKGTIGTSSGALHAKPGMDAGHHVGITSNASYSLDGCALWIEVPQVLSKGWNGETYLMAMVDGSMDAEITATPDAASPSGLKLVFGVEQGGSENNQAIPYDPALHRWWRMRFPAGKVGFDTSADGKTWVEQRVANRPTGMNKAFVELGAGTFSSNGTQPDATFDNLNLPPP
ncbi:MAG: hypothetical protein AMXMBFR56_31530 [Polyangiaceae bacterium]